MTGLSQEGRDVSTTFQTVSKRAKKAGDNELYAKYGTRWGGKGANINLINNLEVKLSYYLIASKKM